MESKCKLILKDTGPLLGSELNKTLVSIYDVSTTNARKIIQRESNNGFIKSSKPVAFKNRQYLYYLSGQDISEMIGEVIQANRKSTYRVYQSLFNNGGLLLLEEAYKVAATVTNKEVFPKNEDTHTLVDSLTKLGIIEKPFEYNGLTFIKGNNSIFTMESPQEFFIIRSRYVNYLFTIYLIDWLKNTNIISWNHEKILEAPSIRVEYNGHLWDGVCYTYLYGYTKYIQKESYNNKVPAICFIESILNRTTNIEDIEGFFTRVTMQDSRMTNYAKGKRLLPILFTNGLTPEALSSARNHGAIIFSLQEILGNRSSELLSYLINPWQSNNSFEKGAELISWIKDKGNEKLLNKILAELYMIYFLSKYKLEGWNVVQNYTFKADNKITHIPWILINEEIDETSICTFIYEDSNDSLKSQLENIIVTQFEPYKHYKNKTSNLNIRIFTESGEVTKKENINQS